LTNAVGARARRGTSGPRAPNGSANGGGAQGFFRRFAQRSSAIFGSAWAFLAALGIILAWGITGPAFHFSDTWQLVINTGTTIVTFLMVFLIQNTQNRDAKAIHLKLDELIRALGPARNRLLELEEMTDEQIERLEQEFRRLRDRAPRVTGEAHDAPPA